jgi:hypothetical protein
MRHIIVECVAQDLGHHIRLQEYPTAVPRAIGRRIAAAGLLNAAAGRVRDGMKVVILVALRNMLVS